MFAERGRFGNVGGEQDVARKGLYPQAITYGVLFSLKKKFMNTIPL